MTAEPDSRWFRLCRFSGFWRIAISCRHFRFGFVIADLRWQRLFRVCGIERSDRLRRGTTRGLQSDVESENRHRHVTRLVRRQTTELAKVLMRRQSLVFVLAFWAWSGRAIAQGPTIDTGVPTLPGSSNSLLGRAPGSGGSALSGNLPGNAAILGGRPGVSTPRGIPTSLANPGAGAGPTDLQMPIRAPQPEPVSPSTTPFYGTLEIPAGEDDGPPDGLTLDHAIDITLERSLDLRSKFFEIPMARADTLQANLRSNPIFYQDGQLLQYKGSPFNRAAPGGPQQFDTNVTYPLDISHKRQARTVVATRAERVLEAQYQDAVRQRIDDIFGAFVTALAARQTVRYARSSVGGLEKLADQTERLFNKGGVSRGDFNRVKIQLQTTRLGRMDAEASYRKAKLDLGSLMNLKLDEIEKLELRGTIADVAPPPPPVDGAGENRRGRTARCRFIASRYPAGRSRRSACQGQRL